jgi:hypothetical protein
MKYHIKRGVTEYGPYSLADLQRYTQSGQIVMNDLCRSEGMTDWVAVSQVVGNVSVPQAGSESMGAYGAAPARAFDNQPEPPNMNWVVVLLIGIFTCGLFGSIWLIIQSLFVKKIDPDNKSPIYLLIYAVFGWLVPIVVAVLEMDNSAGGAVSGLSQLGGFIFYVFAIFKMKTAFEENYLNQLGYSRRLSGVMVFFFAPYYFQYHINDTEKLKRQTIGSMA